MEWVFEDLDFRERTRVFKDREDAGTQLADSLMDYLGSDAKVFAIPSGGVPVGAEVCRILNLPLDVIVVRKIQFPDNPEAGFGAVGPDGAAVLNDYLMEVQSMSHVVVEEQTRKAQQSVEWREQYFRQGRSYPAMREGKVILIDDGLASGFTMLAAIKFVRSRGARKVVVAVPTGSGRAVEMVREKADELHCLNIRNQPLYAVAEAYKNWYDLTDEEALSILRANM